MPPKGTLNNLYEELKRRRVIRVATIYVVALWPVIQIADILSPALELPNSIMQFLLFAFLAGFPVALVLAWLFDLNKSGLVLASETSAGKEQALIGNTFELIIIALLSVAIIVLFFMQNRPAPATEEPLDLQSIAVLPFLSFSSDEQDQFFADGLTEELLNTLSRVRHFRVVARTSSFAYKDVRKNVQTIGAELNVGSILEGSVRHNDIDDTIRVTAQLIDVATGTHLWSDTFDREFKDIFKIQDDIADAVVRQLSATLLGDELTQIKSRSSANPQAMVAHSMGRTELAKRSEISLEDAVRYFKKAAELDSEYAEAYAGLADAYTLLVNYSARPHDAYLRLAQDAVDNALRLDEDLGSAWASQALIYMHAPGKKDESRQALLKAIELNPSYAMAYMWYGNLADDEEERNTYHNKAFELNPRSPVTGYNVASNLINAGKESEAMQVFSRIVEADPFYPGAYKLVAQINESRGRLDEAILQHKKVFEMETSSGSPTQSSGTAAQISSLYSDLGDFENADHWLAITAQDTPKGRESDLLWLKISSMAARGDMEEVQVLIQPFMETTDEDASAYLDTTYANYLAGNLQASITAYERAKLLPATTDMNQDSPFDPDIAAAYCYSKLGDTTAANAILQEISQKLDDSIQKKGRINPDVWFRKSQIAAIKGDQEMMLMHLQRAVDEGWRHHWRPQLDPLFEGMIEHPDFKSMMAGLATRLDLMRKQLALEESFEADWRG